jgi:hypothetical protein
MTRSPSGHGAVSGRSDAPPSSASFGRFAWIGFCIRSSGLRRRPGSARRSGPKHNEANNG